MDDQYPENGRCIPMQASWQHDLVQVDEDGFVVESDEAVNE